jgi:hypothetical protein
MFNFVIGPAVINTHSDTGVGSRSPDGWDQKDPPMDWWLGLAPATLEFWVRFPNERNQRKQSATLVGFIKLI